MRNAKAKSQYVDELNILEICKRKLRAAGFETVGQLLQFCPKRLQFQPHIGPMTFRAVQKVLEERGLHLAKCKRPEGVSLCIQCRHAVVAR